MGRLQTDTSSRWRRFKQPSERSHTQQKKNALQVGPLVKSKTSRLTIILCPCSIVPPMISHSKNKSIKQSEMRLTRKLAPLAVALACALAVACTVECSLAAYSETRSFRDALEGRSMEEAISGPVDKDTSSYGDRTALGGGSRASQGTGESAAMMGLNIPANGNLNGNQMPMQQVEQQKSLISTPSGSDNGGELEREAGPIGGGPNFPSEGQQQMMEQKMAVGARQRASSSAGGNENGARSGRLGAARMMMITPNGAARSARQQQQQVSEAGFSDERASGSKQSAPMEGATGAESNKDNEQQQQSASYGPMAPAAAAATNGQRGNYGGDQQQQQQQVSQPTPMMMMMNNGADQREKNYNQPEGEQQQQQQQQQMMMMGMGMAARQRSMAPPMMATMNKYAAGSMGGQAGSQYGDKRERTNGSGSSSMAQNMIMSLANKAAYMQQANYAQRQRSQAVTPSPMQMGGGYADMNNGANQEEDQQQQQQQMSAGDNGAANRYTMSGGNGMSANQMDARNRMATGRMAGGSGPIRPMRRASQRRPEKKMSPAMMNAMLNKLLGNSNQKMMSPMGMGGEQRQPEQGNYSMGGQQQAAGGNTNSSGQYGQARQAGATMAMLMRSPMGAEMLANMVMNSNAAAMNAMAPAKREQYKRMMMAAMMMQQQQQQQQVEGDSYEGAQQMAQSNGGYGDRPATPRMAPAGGYGMNGAANGGAQNGMAGPMAQAQMNMMTPSPMMTYDKQQQQRTMDSSYGVSARNNQPIQTQMQMQMADNADGMQQQQQREMAAPQNGGAEMGATKIARSTGAQQAMAPASYGLPMTSTMAPMMQTMMMMMDNNKKMMNGNSYSDQSRTQTGYGGPENEQQREMVSTMIPVMMARLNGGAPMGEAAMSYGQQQAPEGAKSQQQQQPMNGFRQAYSQSNDQQQQQQMSGTKSAARPMAPMQANYGGQDQQDDQQQQQEEYGAAPMGQAEPFAFDYKVEDNYGNGHYRKEESDKNGVVRGSYGYMDTSGIYRHVDYVADENGFRANVKSNEPGLSSTEGATKSAPMPNGTTTPQQQSEGPVAQAPPSSSSSLAGSADTQLPMTPTMDQGAAMGNEMQQQQMMQQMQKVANNGAGRQAYPAAGDQGQMSANDSGEKKRK